VVIRGPFAFAVTVLSIALASRAAATACAAELAEEKAISIAGEIEELYGKGALEKITTQHDMAADGVAARGACAAAVDAGSWIAERHLGCAVPASRRGAASVSER
jgi:hypothetical protein